MPRKRRGPGKKPARQHATLLRLRDDELKAIRWLIGEEGEVSSFCRTAAVHLATDAQLKVAARLNEIAKIAKAQVDARNAGQLEIAEEHRIRIMRRQDEIELIKLRAKQGETYMSPESVGIYMDDRGPWTRAFDSTITPEKIDAARDSFLLAIQGKRRDHASKKRKG